MDSFRYIYIFFILIFLSISIFLYIYLFYLIYLSWWLYMVLLGSRSLATLFLEFITVAATENLNLEVILVSFRKCPRMCILMNLDTDLSGILSFYVWVHYLQNMFFFHGCFAIFCKFLRTQYYLQSIQSRNEKKFLTNHKIFKSECNMNKHSINEYARFYALQYGP